MTREHEVAITEIGVAMVKISYKFDELCKKYGLPTGSAAYNTCIYCMHAAHSITRAIALDSSEEIGRAVDAYGLPIQRTVDEMTDILLKRLKRTLSPSTVYLVANQSSDREKLKGAAIILFTLCCALGFSAQNERAKQRVIGCLDDVLRYVK
jgi:hypothetical protein